MSKSTSLANRPVVIELENDITISGMLSILSKIVEDDKERSACRIDIHSCRDCEGKQKLVLYKTKVLLSHGCLTAIYSSKRTDTYLGI